MALSAGTQLGSYEILGPLGAGGMGEVYRARDSRLKRQVAIKVVPELFSSDPERLARFTREAEFLATLNHPNIAAVYGLEESGGACAIVLELVEGDTLADIIARGAIAWQDALPIATQIARALEAAHEKGIIHRDLKPANVKLRPDGTVKVLDFGLAKSLEPTLPEDLTRAGFVQSPGATVAGVIMGTAAYMSPEQARGKAVDKRTDIWAFGCVLFEMLSGTRPFAGETLTDTIAAIVKNEPDWSALPRGTPSAVRSLMARCLKKDVAERLRDAGDARLQLEDALEDTDRAAAAPTRAAARREWAGWIAAVLLLGVALALALRPAPSAPRSPVSFQMFPPRQMSFSSPTNVSVGVPSFALSPDGAALVFVAEGPGVASTLWLRRLDQVAARQLAGTDGAQAPFWSPDSQWIAFVAGGKLKKIPAAGGAIQILTDVSTDFRGGDWGPGDRILFGSGRLPISSVSASGGKATPLTVLDLARQEATHRYPEILPDRRHFVYLVFGANRDRSGLYAESLEGGGKKFLAQMYASAVYVPPGHLLFVEGDALLGQAFDADRLEVTGQRFLVAERVGRSSGFLSAVSASRTGTIAYAENIPQHGRLTWFDRRGHPLEPPPTPDGDYADFRLSPDEHRLSASLVDPKTSILETWITDLPGGTRFRLPSGGSVTGGAVWSPDGKTLMFRTNRNGALEFQQRSAQGGGNDRVVLSSAEIPSNNSAISDWSADGRHLVFSAVPESDHDVWLLTIGENFKAQKLITSPGDQMHGNLSPNGKLLAYTSNESGRFQVYVETMPRSDWKRPVSTGGGYEPRWRADGRELYYLSDDRRLMSVDVGPGPSFGVPKPLFQTQIRAEVTSFRTHYVPTRDGQRFLINTALDTPPSPITVVVDWSASLKK